MDGDRSYSIRIGDSITLTPAQLAWSERVAKTRYEHSRTMNLVHRVPSVASQAPPLKWDLQGAAGELAFDLLMNRPWSASVDVFQVPDSGKFDHVRTTSYADGRLLVRFRDPLDGIYVLMTGVSPTFTFKGAICGYEIPRPRYIDDPGHHGPAYFVPQRDLDEYGEVCSWYLRWTDEGKPPMLTSEDLRW